MGATISKLNPMKKNEFLPCRPLLTMARAGDILEFQNRFNEVSHFAIYVGDETVVHLDHGRDEHVVLSENIFDVAGGNFARINEGCTMTLMTEGVYLRDRETVVEMAMSYVGQKGFVLPWTKCADFASWCRFDVQDNWIYLYRSGTIPNFLAVEAEPDIALNVVHDETTRRRARLKELERGPRTVRRLNFFVLKWLYVLFVFIVVLALSVGFSTLYVLENVSTTDYVNRADAEIDVPSLLSDEADY